ncbi:MAG TPA: hypothetical protein V6C76_12080 [Drouetiella sp.]
MKNRNFRRPSGNMLIFVTAVFLGLVVPLLMFLLWYVRTLGSHQEQRSATEAAALAAADSLSRLVINDANYGYVGISDYAPVASNTQAPDGQNLPVKGINTILATVRLDMIVADQLHDPVMQQLAARDYTNAMSAKDYLNTAMADAIGPSPSQDFRDVDQNRIRPYNDALNAYKQNVIRMTGTANAVNAASFKLSLGCLATPATTNTPTPQPASYASIADSTTTQPSSTGDGTSLYKSYVNIPYNGNNFVFAGCDNSVRLVDPKVFVSTISTPYAIPTIVKVDADQVFAAGRGNPNSSTVHSIACAQPGSTCDPRPSPGALKLDFPDGIPPEITKPGDLLTSPVIGTVPTVLQSPTSGDYPPSGLTPITGGLPSFVPVNPPPTMVSGVMIYDWFKRAGTRPNIKSILDFQNLAIGSVLPQTIAYEWTSTGTIKYMVMAKTAAGYVVPASNMQLYSQTKSPFTSTNGLAYDFVGSDTVVNPGILQGGIHAGEPLVDPMITSSLPEQTSNFLCSNFGVASTIYGANFLVILVVLCKKFSRRVKKAAVLSMSVLSLAACGGPPPTPPDVALSVNSVGPRIPRDTYLKNGMAVELEIKLH